MKATKAAAKLSYQNNGKMAIYHLRIRRNRLTAQGVTGPSVTEPPNHIRYEKLSSLHVYGNCWKRTSSCEGGERELLVRSGGRIDTEDTAYPDGLVALDTGLVKEPMKHVQLVATGKTGRKKVFSSNGTLWPILRFPAGVGREELLAKTQVDRLLHVKPHCPGTTQFQVRNTRSPDYLHILDDREHNPWSSNKFRGFVFQTFVGVPARCDMEVWGRDQNYGSIWCGSNPWPWKIMELNSAFA
jgi:hypothetical protein